MSAGRPPTKKVWVRVKRNWRHSTLGAFTKDREVELYEADLNKHMDNYGKDAAFEKIDGPPSVVVEPETPEPPEKGGMMSTKMLHRSPKNKAAKVRSDK